jgi:uncharacterized protein
MPRIKLILLLSLTALILAPLRSVGITFPEKPSSEHYYVDQAGLLDADTAKIIDTTAAALLTEERIPVYVVTISSLAEQDAVTHTIERYASELFDEWGIGWQHRNHGILLLISKGDRKARIELGADWAGRHDLQAQQIMDELIVPAFKRGDFPAGIADGVRGLDALARGLALPKPQTPWWHWPVLIGSIVLVIAVIFNLFRSGRSGWGWALIAGMGVLIFFIIRAGLSGSGSGGGFGGGSSGGGGASGSW